MYQNVHHHHHHHVHHHHHHQVHHHRLHQVRHHHHHQVHQQSAVELHNRGVHVATIAKTVQPDHRQEALGKPFQGGHGAGDNDVDEYDGDDEDNYFQDDDGQRSMFVEASMPLYMSE